MTGFRKIDPGMVRACAHSGFTRQQAADHCKVSYQAMGKYGHELGLTFVRGRRSDCGSPKKTHDERANAMAARYRDGETLEQIGESYGITRERVRQLINKYHGLNGKDGGEAVQAERRRVEHKATRDAECMETLGCTYQQYRDLLEIGRGIMASGGTYCHTPCGAFKTQRQNARKLGWELNLWQWWILWQQSGHWEDRGRGSGYWMSRIDKSKPFAIGNVKISMGTDGLSRSRQEKSFSPPHELGAEPEALAGGD